MPCENLLIEYNRYDSDELIEQKIGRLGRVGFSTADKVFYYLLDTRKKPKKNKKINKYIREKRENHILLKDKKYKYNSHEDISYEGAYIRTTWAKNKYAKNFIYDVLRKNIVPKKYIKSFKKTYNNIKTEEDKIKKLILSNLNYSIPTCR
jgi:hypothetical protein